MSRLCERPGCSEPGAVAYGMVPEDLLFWVAVPADAPIDDPNLLCRRHADAMVVPRGWTLDDRREEIPRLFKPRPVDRSVYAQQVHHSTRRRRGRDDTAGVRRPAVVHEQLQIDGTGEIARPEPALVAASVAAAPAEPAPPALAPEPVAAIVVEQVERVEPEAAPEPEVEPVADVEQPEQRADPEGHQPWQPEFDVDDNLNGLLEVSSPLLARAFRGTGRRRR